MMFRFLYAFWSSGSGVFRAADEGITALIFALQAIAAHYRQRRLCLQAIFWMERSARLGQRLDAVDGAHDVHVGSALPVAGRALPRRTARFLGRPDGRPNAG